MPGTFTTGGETGRWMVREDQLRDARAPPPSFELVGLSAPDAVAPNQPVQVTVTLRNVGDGDGNALVTLSEFVDGAYVGAQANTVDVGAGSEVPFSVTLGTLVDRQDAGEVRLAVRTSGGDREATIAVEGS